MRRRHHAWDYDSYESLVDTMADPYEAQDDAAWDEATAGDDDEEQEDEDW